MESELSLTFIFVILIQWDGCTARCLPQHDGYGAQQQRQHGRGRRQWWWEETTPPQPSTPQFTTTPSSFHRTHVWFWSQPSWGIYLFIVCFFIIFLQFSYISSCVSNKRHSLLVKFSIFFHLDLVWITPPPLLLILLENLIFNISNITVIFCNI